MTCPAGLIDSREVFCLSLYHHSSAPELFVLSLEVSSFLGHLDLEPRFKAQELS